MVSDVVWCYSHDLGLNYFLDVAIFFISHHVLIL